MHTRFMLQSTMHLFLLIFIPCLYLHLYPRLFVQRISKIPFVRSALWINLTRLDLLIFTGKRRAVFSNPSQSTSACSSSSSGGRWLTAGWWPCFLVLLEWHWVKQQWHCWGSSAGPHAVHQRSGSHACRATCHCDVPDEDGSLKL